MTAALARRGTAPGRHVYDTIVVGGQLGGAITTALLARRGLHVLHVPHDGLTAPYVHGEWKLPYSAFLLPPLKALPALEEVLTELGINTTIARQLDVPPLQLLQPGRWYELPNDEKDRAKELKRVWGDHGELFDAKIKKAIAAADTSDAFFRAKHDFPPEGFFAKWKFKRALPRFEGMNGGTPLPADELLRGLEPFAACVDGPAPLTQSRALGRLLVGPAVFPGGLAGLATALLDRARELGADVLDADESIELLSFDGSKAAGVRLSRTDVIYRAPFVVAACDLDALARIVPEAKRGAADELVAKLAPKKALFTLNVVLPEGALPRGLGTLGLIEAARADEPPVLFQIAPVETETAPKKGNGDPSDLRVLTVARVAPLALKQGGEPAIRAFIDQLWGTLAQVMPFTRQHARLESTPWLDAPPVVAGRGEPWPLFPVLPDAWFGITALTTSSPWKRLLLASRQVMPGLGIEGEIRAATRAVAMIEATLKKNDPLKARKTG